jgi:L-aspartate oxidase
LQKKKVLIIGSGIAGSMASNLLQRNFIVTILTKKAITDSNSMLAQGGIAVALDKNDSSRDHYEDSLSAGCFYNDSQALKQLVTKGPKVLQNLIDSGMDFDKCSDGAFSYGLEGAHKRPRILHIGGDKTGNKMTSFLHCNLRNVEIKENTVVVEILSKDNTCFGVKILNSKNEIELLYSDYVILATGGIGQMYPLTSNSETITGDGIAMAYRAGCELKDMEFVQFHPTLLSIDHSCYGLISEAVRGEGATLVREDGSKVMKGKHEFEDLAPRDVVSRKISSEIDSGEKVFLDISGIPNFKERFPAITENLKKHNIPFEETKRIPIHPGAHFFMGGIKTDLNGETSIKNLFAIGETACTGVHGANRLASNSLLEAIVFAEATSKTILDRINDIDTINPYCHQKINSSNAYNCRNGASTEKSVNLPNIIELQQRSWENIGITRSEENIAYFLDWLSNFDFLSPISDEYLNKENFECQNLCLIAQLIAKAALKRKKSIGAHYITKGI